MTYLEKLLQNRRRNKRVLALAAKGQGTTEIGERVGISKQLAHSIIKKAKNGATSRTVRPDQP